MKRIQRHIRDDFSRDQSAGSPQPKEPARLIVHLTDSRKLEKTVLFAKGTSENPLSGIELETKFNTLTQNSIPEDKATTLCGMLLDLESPQEVSILTDYLSCQNNIDSCTQCP